VPKPTVNEYEVGSAPLVVIDDLLTPKERRECFAELFYGYAWGYGARSRRGGDPEFPFWGRRHLPTLPPQSVRTILDKVRPLAEPRIDGPWSDYELTRIVCGAHTAGSSGYIHFDRPKRAKSVSILYYGNLRWNSNWAGDTKFFSSRKEIGHSVLPRPGRVAVFPSHVLHAAAPVANICADLRVTMSILIRRRRRPRKFRADSRVSFPFGVRILRSLHTRSGNPYVVMLQDTRILDLDLDCGAATPLIDRVLEEIALMGRGSTTVAQLAARMELPTDVVIKVLDVLLAHGLLDPPVSAKEKKLENGA